MKVFFKIFLATIIGSMAFSALASASEFDGQWRANASTENGKCKDKFVFDLQISLGQISGVVSGKKKSHQLQGTVDSDGRFYINVVGMSKDGFRGTIRGDSGEGTWNTGKCNGALTLKK